MTADEIIYGLAADPDNLIESVKTKTKFDASKVFAAPHPTLGIKTGVLRKAAIAELANEDFELKTVEHTVFKSLCIGKLKTYEETVGAVKAYAPKLDSWAACDILLVSTAKVFAKNRERVWEDFVNESPSGEYERRFAIGLMLKHFLTESDMPRVINRLKQLEDDRYYVQMMIAWTLAEATIKFPNEVNACLPSFSPTVQKMTIRKQKDSFRVKTNA